MAAALEYRRDRFVNMLFLYGAYQPGSDKMEYVALGFWQGGSVIIAYRQVGMMA